jgi:predicted GNAT family acetyltransferase
MTSEVQHDEQRSRYELVVDGRLVGLADYREHDGVRVFTHTEISPERRGEGLGATLVRGALDDTRNAGRTVVPRCWFVGQFIDENPEYADLLAA